MAAKTHQHRRNTFCPCYRHKHSRSDGHTHLGTSPQAQSPQGWGHTEATQTLYLLLQPSHSTASTLYTLECFSRRALRHRRYQWLCCSSLSRHPGTLTRHRRSPASAARPAFVVSAGSSCAELGREGLCISLHFFH